MDPSIVLFICILLSGVFSGLEIAFFSLSAAKIEALVLEGYPGATLVQKLRATPDKLLVTILIGNNIVNITASTLATLIATERFGSSGAGIAVGVMTVLILIFGEITPKSLATRYSIFIACRLAWFVRFLSLAMTPVVWVFVSINHLLTKRFGERQHTVSEEEIQAMTKMGVASGSIEKEEEKMIRNIFDFGDTVIEQVMTPRIDMVAFEVNSSLGDVYDQIKDGTHSRYPIYEETIDKVVGVLYVRDLLHFIGDDIENVQIKNLIKAPIFAPETNHIRNLFQEMKQEKIHIAIVIEEHGGTAGIVTMEDIIEELVGEIVDETDNEEVLIKPAGEATWMVSGKTEIKRLIDIASLEGDFEDMHQSLSSYIIETMEKMPEVDEVYETEHFSMTVVEVSNNVIETVEVVVK